MTGYGRGQSAKAGTGVTAEVRTVNHRFLDVSVRLPKSVTSLEIPLRKRLGERFSRGRIEFSLSLDAAGARTTLVSANLPLAREYAQAARQIADAAGIKGTLKLSTLMMLPEVLSVVPLEMEADLLLEAAMEALEAACDAADSDRQREGEQLKLFFEEHLSLLEAAADELETAAPQQPLQFSSLDYLGHVDGTYLVFAAPGVLVLLDQHAAHERILFEKLRASKAAGPEVQSLLIPEILEMSPGDFQRLTASLDLLREAGVEVEPFGVNTAAVKTVPALLGEMDAGGLVRELLDAIAEAGLPRDEKRDRIFIRMACRGAIKANHPLGEEEVRRLCRDLDAIPFASNCPHGRPVFVELPAPLIERMFKRT